MSAVELADAIAEATKVNAFPARDGSYGSMSILPKDFREKVSAIIAQRDALLAASRPGAEVLSHKWLDPGCIHTGCQTLTLQDRIASLQAQVAEQAGNFQGVLSKERESAEQRHQARLSALEAENAGLVEALLTARNLLVEINRLEIAQAIDTIDDALDAKARESKP